MRVRLEYGRRGLDVELPGRNVAAVLRGAKVEPIVDVEQRLRNVLGEPIGCAPLVEIARGKRNACIVIPDKTRPLPNAVVLPAILATLEDAGIPAENVTILIATGLHRPNQGEELIELVGDEIAGRWRCENHDARDEAAHVHLGRTSRAVPMLVDRRYVEADLKILVGLVEPHFMAGYSGGRKMVCPGICAARTIKAFHGPALLEDPNAAGAVLAGNPVHETALETAKAAGVDFTVNVAIDESRNIVGVFAGELEKAHEATCSLVRDFTTACIRQRVPIVVTSAGGYPLDDTFYQAVKGMVGPLPVLEEGGTVIIAAAIGEGIGSDEYERLMTGTTDWRAFREWIMQPGNYVVDQWEFQMQVKALEHAEIVMVSDGMTHEELESCFVTPAASVEDAVEAALAKHGADARIAVIPQGPYVTVKVA